jgi:hypothetical protein
MFLPGTVFTSLSQSKIAGAVDFEAYFKRTTSEEINEVLQFPNDWKWVAKEIAGLHFGKTNKLKQTEKDIIYLKKIKC